MKRIRTIAIVAAAAGGILVGLTACTSPFLTRIKQVIAEAPFTGSSYTFVRQWGNDDPEHTYYDPIVKADSASNIYVADSTYRIRKFDTSGTLQSTVSGVSRLGPNAVMYDMAFDPAGNRYITTKNIVGSTAIAGAPQIQKYDSSGTLLAEWATSADQYGGLAIDRAQGIALDSSGNIYVVDSGNGRVVKFGPNLSYITSWGGSTPYGPAGGTPMSAPTGIAVTTGSSPSVYILDSGNNRVVEFDDSGVYQTEFGGAGSTYAGLAMSNPSAIALGKVSFTTYLFVADSSNDRVIQFTTAGSDVAVFGTSSPAMNDPRSVAVDPQGHVYVGDSGAGSADFFGRVMKYSVSSTPTHIATWGGADPTANGDLSAPWGVVFDSSGNLIVSEAQNGRLQKFTSAGKWLATWTSSNVHFPVGLTIDSSDKTYVVDISGQHYEIFSPSGADLGTVGTSGTAPGTFGFPTGIAYDGADALYVTDPGNMVVQKFGTDGFYKNLEWGSAGTGNGQFAVDDLAGNYGIAVDPAGYVYVSDYVANRVQKFDFSGKFISKFGSYGTGNGQFNAPMGMAVDKSGNLYVCDMMNHRVQKFNSDGDFMGSFGTVGAGSGGFGWPTGVAVDVDGNVAVVDYAGGLVQLFAPTF